MSARPYYSLRTESCIGCRGLLGRSYATSGHFKANPPNEGQTIHTHVLASWHERCEAKKEAAFPESDVVGCYGLWEPWMGVRMVGER
jgi:hypothetical protein